MSDKRKEDLYSIGAIYGDMLNGVKTAVVTEDKTVPPGEVGNADLITKDSGPTERGGFEPAAIDIDRMTDKEKAENLYNIKGLTYGDGNNPGPGNQEPLPTGPEFNQVPYTGNVGASEEDEEEEDNEGGNLDAAQDEMIRLAQSGENPHTALRGVARKHGIDPSVLKQAIFGKGVGENEEDEEILSEHEKNARRSLNNFMAKQSVFDKLYNKVMVSEEFEEEFSETEDLAALDITEEEPEEITVTLPSDLAQTLCDILTAALQDQEVDVETEVDVSETETLDFEEDEEAVMKDGGGYGVDAGSTLKTQINYGKGGQNKVGKLKPATGLAQKDGGGYGVDAGSTLNHTVDHALKNNKVGNLKPGPIPGA